MHPILYQFPQSWPLVGGFPIRSFSVMVLIGVLAAAWWVNRRFHQEGLSAEGALDHLLRNTLILGFIGARLTYVAIHPEAYSSIIDLVAVWKGGIVSYGGFFGGALGAWFFARKRQIGFLQLGDICVPALVLAQVFGRVGCLLVGDDHGSPWDGPWAVTFPSIEGGLIPPELVGVPLHPSQIYLSLMNLVIFLALIPVYHRRSRYGQVMVMGMLLYAIGRFSVEFTRGDDQARGIYGALSTAQWWSLATAALALLAWFILRSRPPLQAPAAAPEPSAP